MSDKGSKRLPVLGADELLAPGPGGEGFSPATTDLDDGVLSTRPPSRSVVDQLPPLADLLDVESFRDICASFVDLYKIGIKIFDADGTKLIDIRVGNGDWCGYIFSNPTGRAKCTALVTRIKQFRYPELEAGAVVEQPCFSGLKYVVMPVAYGGDLLGRVVYGPFLPAQAEGPGEEVARFGEGFDPDRLWRYGEKIRRAPDETIIKILRNFRGVVDTVTFIAMKSLMTRQLHVESITASYNDLAEANRKLRGSLERLEELDKLKSSFLAMVSHELKTPLTSVIGYSEMLIDGVAGDLNDDQRRYLQTIRDKGESLLDLIGSLLDLSRIEAGHFDLKPRPVVMARVVDEALSSVVPQAKKKRLNLLTAVADDLPYLRGDPDRLRQVLVNLLGNAVKFTPEGGTVEVRVERFRGPRSQPSPEHRFGPPDEDFVRVEVRDDGLGIPPDKLDRIFESFYQVDGSITRAHGGTGLGLAITKRLVEAHGGEITVRSRPADGSCFTVLLPCPSGA